MPRHLDACARSKWRELVPLLLDMGILTLADRTSLELLCMAYSEYRLYKRVSGKAKGMLGDQRHPLVSSAADAWRRYSVMMREFGLSPSARGRVDLGAAPPPPAGAPAPPPSRLPDDGFQRYLDGTN